ncbi:hypothetical protein TL16_g01953 [Triparma laevis f. inornata]|uniref:Mitochondrial carrier n=1 Tax=Triparma laevis f. inornata TaxID=1714386 RepID=A0A9W6ZQP4_9STRA|nr:hypothetical protein TL16_g01953 [Triparma laevis f. inornata]
MDLPLLLSFQTILSDLELLKMITSRYLHSPSFITLTDGTKIPCRIDKKSFFQCLGILLENGESAWLRENEPSLSAKLDEEEHSSTILPPFLLTLIHSIVNDLFYYPFYALKTAHVSQTFRTPELASLVSSNPSSGRSPCYDCLLQIRAFGSLKEIYRGSIAVCLLGLLRNYAHIQSREMIKSTDHQSFTYTPSLTGIDGIQHKSIKMLHNGSKVKDRPNGRQTGKERASGNVFWDSEGDLTRDRKRIEEDMNDDNRVSWYGRGMFAVLAHPLELIAVRQITRPMHYTSFFNSVGRLWGLGVKEFFTGWRSTFITAITMKDKWYFLGIPGLVRVRRMVEEAPTIPGDGGVVGGVLGGDSLGKSLEIIRSTLEKKGGWRELIVGLEVTVRILVPAFLAAGAARSCLSWLGEGEMRKRVRRRREVFIRTFFEKSRVEVKRKKEN